MTFSPTSGSNFAVTIKICVVLSPAAGPAGFARLIHPGSREDLVRIVVQRHASAGELEELAECLEELAEQPVLRAPADPATLHGGSLCLLGEAADVRLEGYRLILGEKGQALDLDAFLAALAPWREKAAVSVLPGLEIPHAARRGLSALTESGAALFAAAEDVDPQGWSAGLQAAGIPLRRVPWKALGDPAPSAPPGERRLLLADDDAVMRTVWGELCRLQGFACEDAADGIDVLKMLRQGRYDGLILDLNMPEMDGVEALRRLRSEWPLLPVLVISGETDPEVLERVRALGAVGVLNKAYSNEQFQRALSVFADSKPGAV